MADWRGVAGLWDLGERNVEKVREMKFPEVSSSQSSCRVGVIEPCRFECSSRRDLQTASLLSLSSVQNSASDLDDCL